MDDPPVAVEGRFEIGRYVPDKGEVCAWDPWDGGEQMLGVFGTTGSGKTETGKLIAAIAASWGWDVIAMDGAKDGLDFAFMGDSNIGRVISGDDIAIELTAIADEIERRGRVLNQTRVRRTDRKGVERAATPQNLRYLTLAERERAGIRPILVLIDELAIALKMEQSAPAPKAVKGKTPEARRPIQDALFRAAASGRFAGVHLVGLMQRGDAELLSGFIGNLFRARLLVGSADQTAGAMAHGAGVMNLWRELMVADGWEPDGMESAMRPPGRAFVSGLSSRPPGLVQLYRFDSVSRFMPWSDYEARGIPPVPDPDHPSPSPDFPDGPDDSGGGPSPSLTLVGVAPLDTSDTLNALRLDGKRESSDAIVSPPPRLRSVE